jgi:hypothetical protein
MILTKSPCTPESPYILETDGAISTEWPMGSDPTKLCELSGVTACETKLLTPLLN